MVAGCGDDSPGKPPDAAPLDMVSEEPPICPEIVGPGTMHGASVNAPETWTASMSPINLPFDTSITAAVTIEKCAVVRIGAGKQVSVLAGGSLTANGVTGGEVKIEKLDAAEWVNIRALNGGRLSFTDTIVSGGGDPLNGIAVLAGTLDVAGTTPTPMPVLHAERLRITSSKSSGITLHDGGAFDATSAGLEISGAMQFPISTFARLLGSIPSGTYTGNTTNEILVHATGGPEAIAESLTIRDRGVPYRIGYQPGSVLDIGAVTGLATVTIEPGVTLRFAPGATMRIEPATGTAPARGALVATGTAAKRITFTSAAATPAAGDWYGLWFGGTPATATRLDFAKVEYAGKLSATGSDSCASSAQTGPNDAAIRLLGGAPATVFITNTDITASARHGIDRGFRSDTKPSFLPTNQFIMIAGCRESLPRDANGACPATLPCP